MGREVELLCEFYKREAAGESMREYRAGVRESEKERSLFKTGWMDTVHSLAH